ncbi:MAG: GNAT family N-acetyltransferase [Clostridia bacterium]|nr:GNAT family N-acetyltransferase [Clostridia bacterium]
MTVELIKAKETDAEEIWKMQKSAFAELFEKYKDFDTSPANEPLDKVILRLRQPFTYFYFIRLNGKNIGAIRVVDKKSSTEPKRISPLFILPEFRNKGYAQSAILQVEKVHGASNWELDTILQETSTCRLYEKTGYRKTDRIKKINTDMTLIFYKK